MTEGEASPIVAKLEQVCDLLRQLVAKDHPVPRRLLRLREAAHYLHVSPWQLRRIIQADELPVIRPIDDHQQAPWLIDVKELDAWIERTKSNL